MTRLSKRTLSKLPKMSFLPRQMSKLETLLKKPLLRNPHRKNRRVDVAYRSSCPYPS